MGADLFVSYAWTTTPHRDWVRLLASHMKLTGYDVLVDADVDYGNSLTGFMRRAVDCRHVLMIVDENYVDRADNVPSSGVALENGWVQSVYADRPPTWLGVLFKDNPSHLLPAWLTSHKPNGFQFNADVTSGNFPGSEQIDELWRWIEELPANQDHKVTAATLRARAKRIEIIDRHRDPSAWSSPSLEGEIVFEWDNSPDGTYSMGHGEFQFQLRVSGEGENSVYVYTGPGHAVGINRTGATAHTEIASQLTPGPHVTPTEGQQAILLNTHGAICLVDIVDVQRATDSATGFQPAILRFRYRILVDS